MSSPEFRRVPAGAADSVSPFAVVPTASPDPQSPTDSAIATVAARAISPPAAPRSAASPEQVVPGAAVITSNSARAAPDDRVVPTQNSGVVDLIKFQERRF